MTQEQKDLLLKDLCARLPYGVKVEITRTNWYSDKEEVVIKNIKSVLPSMYAVSTTNMTYSIQDVKPYLFPFSSMTEEQIKEYMTIPSGYRTIDWFNKNHFDYRCLIENGLAIDATNLNIY